MLKILSVKYTFGNDLLVFGHVPALLFASRARHYNVVQIFWIGSNLEMLIAQVTLHAKLVDGRREVHAHLLLLGIVAHAHGDVRLAPIAPDVVGHLKADDENALVEFARSLAQRMRAMVGVE